MHRQRFPSERGPIPADLPSGFGQRFPSERGPLPTDLPAGYGTLSAVPSAGSVSAPDDAASLARPQGGRRSPPADGNTGHRSASTPGISRRRSDPRPSPPVRYARPPSRLNSAVSSPGGPGRESRRASVRASGAGRKGRLWVYPADVSLLGKSVFSAMYVVLFSLTCIVLFGERFFRLDENEDEWCDLVYEGQEYENPDYDPNPCLRVPLPQLLWLSRHDCDVSRRLLASVFLGGIIGYERRSSDRPAGIRTMGLVSLGSCCFTLSSNFGFRSSTMGWDSSRVSAALPSGVGFLGAALIWKGQMGSGDN
eukprot:CAMPEP_0194317296 /NCGR_PEP_ID=MMETSP0171-20130528/14029_1 /TAXON_ID=218684 /ORGANISM="Corethron pennatum, Strain L29A3" /LENGTH=308 /DNA_ID=CAMNT_0039073821 /DNA_START=232 /DNA_END=1155 /DNA_ORIENTATION=-